MAKVPETSQKIRACVDLGTNSALLLVASVGKEGLKVLEDQACVVRLGQEVDQRRSFHPEALRRLELTLKAYRERCDQLGVGEALSVATSATRDVDDPAPLVNLCQKYGFPLVVLSGDQEATYTYLGAGHHGSGRSVVIDVGGGSTEMVWGEGGKILEKQSIDVGAVRMTERHLHSHPATEEMVEQLEQDLVRQFSSLKGPQVERSDSVVAVAGTPTSLVALEMGKPFEKPDIDGYTLSRQQVKSWAQRLSALSLKQRAELPGMPPGREDVLGAGAFVLAAALQALGAEKVTVSTRGLRFGVLEMWEEVKK